MAFRKLLLSMLLFAMPLSAEVVRVRVSGELYGIAAGPDGNAWVTIADLTPAVWRMTPGGELRAFRVSAAILGDITTGPDGALWFDAYSSVGRVTTAGSVSTIPLGGRPVSTGITTGADGALWAGGTTAMYRVTTGGNVTVFPLPATVFNSHLALGPDDAVWFTGGGQLRRITALGAITVLEQGLPNDSPIVAAPDRSIWFAAGQSTLARIDGAGQRRTWTVPPEVGGVQSIAIGPDASVWIAGGKALGHLQGGTFETYPIAPQLDFGTWRRKIAVAADGRIWIAQYKGNFPTSSLAKGVAPASQPGGGFSVEILSVDPASLAQLAMAVPMNSTITLLILGVAIVAVAVLRLR